MISQVLADRRKVVNGHNPERRQRIGVPNTRVHKNGWGSNDARRKDDLLGGIE